MVNMTAHQSWHSERNTQQHLSFLYIFDKRSTLRGGLTVCIVLFTIIRVTLCMLLQLLWMLLLLMPSWMHVLMQLRPSWWCRVSLLPGFLSTAIAVVGSFVGAVVVNVCSCWCKIRFFLIPQLLGLGFQKAYPYNHATTAASYAPLLDLDVRLKSKVSSKYHVRPYLFESKCARSLNPPVSSKPSACLIHRDAGPC